MNIIIRLRAGAYLALREEGVRSEAYHSALFKLWMASQTFTGSQDTLTRLLAEKPSNRHRLSWQDRIDRLGASK